MDGLRNRLEKYLEGKDFHFNADADMVNGILGAMLKRREKFGHDYCPCRRPSGDAEKDKEIICPCAFHLEELEKDGHCHCYLFVKE
jgi:ferredoxin-thioredoxin reductase catalytic subunit